MIRSAWIIARKEFACFFFSPAGYVLLFIVTLATGFSFYDLVSQLSQHANFLPAAVFSPGQLLGFLLVAFLLTPPLTMRLFAEEKRSGTLETLVTAPVTDPAIVLGKFLAAFLFYCLFWVPSLLFLAIAHVQGGRFDLGLLAANLFGALETGALFLAAGLFASSVAASQIIAAAVGLLLNFALLFGPYLVGSNIRHEGLRSVFQRVNPFTMLGESTQVGVLDTSHTVYFLGLAALFLFLTVRSVEARKWR